MCVVLYIWMFFFLFFGSFCYLIRSFPFSCFDFPFVCLFFKFCLHFGLEQSYLLKFLCSAIWKQCCHLCRSEDISTKYFYCFAVFFLLSNHLLLLLVACSLIRFSLWILHSGYLIASHFAQNLFSFVYIFIWHCRFSFHIGGKKTICYLVAHIRIVVYCYFSIFAFQEITFLLIFYFFLFLCCFRIC